MTTIRKYCFDFPPDRNEVIGLVKVLKVGKQGDKLYFWALVGVYDESVSYVSTKITTDEFPFKGLDGFTYFDTIIDDEHSWHVFMKVEERVRNLWVKYKLKGREDLSLSEKSVPCVSDIDGALYLELTHDQIMNIADYKVNDEGTGLILKNKKNNEKTKD